MSNCAIWQHLIHNCRQGFWIDPDKEVFDMYLLAGGNGNLADECFKAAWCVYATAAAEFFRKATKPEKILIQATRACLQYRLRCIKKHNWMGGWVTGWLPMVRGVEKLWENGIPPKHWRPYEIEPNSLECRFRLDMSIKIKLIVIVGGSAPRWSNEKKTGRAPTGKSPPSALLAISYIFIWVLSLAAAREPSVNKACVCAQGYGGRVVSERWSVHKQRGSSGRRRESEWGGLRPQEVVKQQCRRVWWWKVTEVTENSRKNAYFRSRSEEEIDQDVVHGPEALKDRCNKTWWSVFLRNSALTLF